jgi:NAD(P)-dependent dehydrogenase (short-subunit alcohol dehydrogenase family)
MAEDDRPSAHKLLVFGARGAIGGAVMEGALLRSWNVVAATRALDPIEKSERAQGTQKAWISIDPYATNFRTAELKARGPYSAVCWAQGANLNDSVFTVDLNRNLEIYKANCGFILATLRELLESDLLTKPARLCVISSIWQNVSRQDKLSYTMTKAALQGLVLSASTDLAAAGHLINAVLPGAIDTPMTRQNLLPSQIKRLRSGTKFNRLSTLADVVSLTLYLCSPDNTGITGQFIAADLGFSHVHLL